MDAIISKCKEELKEFSNEVTSAARTTDKEYLREPSPNDNEEPNEVSQNDNEPQSEMSRNLTTESISDKFKNYVSDAFKQYENVKQQHNQQEDGLIAAVENYKRLYPEKHKSAQLQGDHIMNSNYDLEIGVDLEGNKIEANRLLQALQQGLPVEELTDSEVELLNTYAGEWKVI